MASSWRPCPYPMASTSRGWRSCTRSARATSPAATWSSRPGSCSAGSSTRATATSSPRSRGWRPGAASSPSSLASACDPRPRGRRRGRTGGCPRGRVPRRRRIGFPRAVPPARTRSRRHGPRPRRGPGRGRARAVPGGAADAPRRRGGREPLALRHERRHHQPRRLLDGQPVLLRVRRFERRVRRRRQPHRGRRHRPARVLPRDAVRVPQRALPRHRPVGDRGDRGRVRELAGRDAAEHGPPASPGRCPAARGRRHHADPLPCSGLLRVRRAGARSRPRLPPHRLRAWSPDRRRRRWPARPRVRRRPAGDVPALGQRPAPGERGRGRGPQPERRGRPTRVHGASERDVPRVGQRFRGVAGGFARARPRRGELRSQRRAGVA